MTLKTLADVREPIARHLPAECDNSDGLAPGLQARGDRFGKWQEIVQLLSSCA
jgi:hypothetical protein